MLAASCGSDYHLAIGELEVLVELVEELVELVEELEELDDAHELDIFVLELHHESLLVVHELVGCAFYGSTRILEGTFHLKCLSFT